MKINSIEPVDSSIKEKMELVKNLHHKVIALSTSCFCAPMIAIGGSFGILATKCPAGLISLPIVAGLISCAIGLKKESGLKEIVNQHFFSEDNKINQIGIEQKKWLEQNKANTAKRICSTISNITLQSFLVGGSLTALAGFVFTIVSGEAQSGLVSLSLIHAILGYVCLRIAICDGKDFAEEMAEEYVTKSLKITKTNG